MNLNLVVSLSRAMARPNDP